MNDDARLLAALATGHVSNDSFELSRDALVTRNGTTIHDCEFYLTRAEVSIVVTAREASIRNCNFIHGRRPDEMKPLYDLLEESHGSAKA